MMQETHLDKRMNPIDRINLNINPAFNPTNSIGMMQETHDDPGENNQINGSQLLLDIEVKPETEMV